MIVVWNSLMIFGLVRIVIVFNSLEYLELVMNVVYFIIINQQIDGCFYWLNYEGKFAVIVQLEDYVLFIKVLLDLQQVLISLEILLKLNININFWLEIVIKL